MGGVLGRLLPCMRPEGDVAMPEYGSADHRPPQTQLDHISEERSSQMRGLESSQKAPSSKTGSLRDSFESPVQRNSGQRRRSGENSLENQRNKAGQKDPEKEEDKQFLDSASDVSDLPALPSQQTYLRKKALRGLRNGDGIPDCLTPFSEGLRSNRSACTMEAVDALEPACDSAGARMDSYLEQERRNSFDTELSLGTNLGSQSIRSLASSRENFPSAERLLRQSSV